MKNREKKIPPKNEIHENMIQQTSQELRKSFKGKNVHLQDNQNPKKYSEIFSEFLEPAINEVIDNEHQVKAILNWGQFLWNKAVADDFPNHKFSKDIKRLFPFFKLTFRDKDLISVFLNRKREMFVNENFFIVKHTSLLENNGRLCISVAVLSIDEEI